jgi:hypothetical protein
MFLSILWTLLDVMGFTPFKVKMLNLRKWGNLNNTKSAGRSGSLRQMKSRFRSGGGGGMLLKLAPNLTDF